MNLKPEEILARLVAEEVLPAPATGGQARCAADAPALDHWTSPVLLERAAYLRKLARAGDGAASETLKEFPQHTAMLLARTRSGQAEVHERFADLFFVLDGRATLVTGGTVAGAQVTAPGEIRGSSVEGGTAQELKGGDFAHVPAGVPHQMLVAGEGSAAFFVLKICETPTD